MKLTCSDEGKEGPVLSSDIYNEDAIQYSMYLMGLPGRTEWDKASAGQAEGLAPRKMSMNRQVTRYSYQPIHLPTEHLPPALWFLSSEDWVCGLMRKQGRPWELEIAWFWLYENSPAAAASRKQRGRKIQTRRRFSLCKLDWVFLLNTANNDTCVRGLLLQ